MLFSNSLVSFIAAIALAGSVTAAVTPRGGGTPSGQSCSTGSLSCCESVSPFSSVEPTLQGGLLGILDPVTDANVPIGLNCVADGLVGCDNQAVCCSGGQQQIGLVNLGLNCVNVG